MKRLAFCSFLALAGCAPATSVSIVIERADASDLNGLAWEPFATFAEPDTRPALDRVVLASALVSAAIAPRGHHSCQLENAHILVPWVEVPEVEATVGERVPLAHRPEVAAIPKDPPNIPQDEGWDRTLILILRCEPAGVLTARVEFRGS